jgi:hypothetical protein
MDKRRLVVIAVIAAFMVVPIAHVAAYTGSLERDGWQWVGWFYAVGVDASIAVCAWFTRWQTTRRPSVFGYVLFSLMDGAFNIGYIQPWEKDTPVAAWAYAILPTAAVIVLGWLIRDVGKFSKRKDTADAETARLRASLKETRAELTQAHTETEQTRAELAQKRTLRDTSFDDFVQLYAGDGATLREMAPSDGNLALVRAGFAPIAESTWRNWRDKAQKGANDEP